MKKERPNKEKFNRRLYEKRVKLVGDDQFIPKSYLHLAHFWNILSDEEFYKGVEYAMIRNLALKNQGRKVVWTHKTELELLTSMELSAHKMRAIERYWGKIVKILSLKEIDILDWIVDGTPNYDMLQSYLRERMLSAQKILSTL